MNLRIRKLPAVFLFLALLNIITIVTAPFTIPPGTVRGLDGDANRMDYTDLWEDLNPYAALVYGFGDFNCHQNASRSFHLNDNQLPVCARDTGLALGFIFGSFLLVIAIPNADPFRMMLSPIAGKKALTLDRKKAIALVVIFGTIFMIPLAVDGLLQAFTDYISNNTLRFVTGLFFATAFIFGIGAYLESFIFKHLYIKQQDET
jgi:uncharacterized membrane protein